MKTQIEFNNLYLKHSMSKENNFTNFNPLFAKLTRNILENFRRLTLEFAICSEGPALSVPCKFASKYLLIKVDYRSSWRVIPL